MRATEFGSHFALPQAYRFEEAVRVFPSTVADCLLSEIFERLHFRMALGDNLLTIRKGYVNRSP